MASKTLADLAARMRRLDIAMLSTLSADGAQFSSRPMSNNGDVEYDGNSYFFTYDGSRTVQDIEANPAVGLTFQGPDRLYLSITGTATLHRDKPTLQKHWVPDVEAWYKDGIDTPGIVLVRVQALRVKYWQDEDEGEVVLSPAP